MDDCAASWSNTPWLKKLSSDIFTIGPAALSKQTAAPIKEQTDGMDDSEVADMAEELAHMHASAGELGSDDGEQAAEDQLIHEQPLAFQNELRMEDRLSVEERLLKVENEKQQLEREVAKRTTQLETAERRLFRAQVATDEHHLGLEDGSSELEAEMQELQEEVEALRKVNKIVVDDKNGAEQLLAEAQRRIAELPHVALNLSWTLALEQITARYHDSTLVELIARSGETPPPIMLAIHEATYHLAGQLLFQSLRGGEDCSWRLNRKQKVIDDLNHQLSAKDGLIETRRNERSVAIIAAANTSMTLGRYESVADARARVVIARDERIRELEQSLREVRGDNARLVEANEKMALRLQRSARAVKTVQ